MGEGQKKKSASPKPQLHAGGERLPPLPGRSWAIEEPACQPARREVLRLRPQSLCSATFVPSRPRATNPGRRRDGTCNADLADFRGTRRRKTPHTEPSTCACATVWAASRYSPACRESCPRAHALRTLCNALSHFRVHLHVQRGGTTSDASMRALMIAGVYIAIAARLTVVYCTFSTSP